MKLFSGKKKDNKEEKESDESLKSVSELEKLDEKNIDKKESDPKKKSLFGSTLDRRDKKIEQQAASTVIEDKKSKETRTKSDDEINGQNRKQAQSVLTNPSEKQTTVQLEQTSVNDDEIKKIIQVISENKEGAISPSINFEESRLYFPALAHLGTHEYVASLLEKLCSPSINMLEKTVLEKLAVCPEHPQNLSSTIRLYCSSCFATDIVKLHLIEHKVCGYITEIRDYNQTSDFTTCISCKHQIKDPQKEIRRLGRWYECNKCKVKFDNCVMKLHCRKFNHDFDINQASMILIPLYKLKAEAKSSQVYSLSLIPQIEKILQSHGCTIQDASLVKGRSGVVHKVSIYASGNDKTILIDIKSSEKIVDDMEINSTIVKVLDVGPTLAIFVGIPTISDAVKTMANANKILVITGNNLSEILSTVEQNIKSHL